MKEAFTYMFKDNKFWVKGLSYLFLIFTANLLLNYAQTILPPCPKCSVSIPWQYWIFFISGTLVNTVAIGYLFSCIKALIEHIENPVLPFVNILKDFYKGFKYSVSLLMLILPIGVALGLFMLIIALITSGSAVGLILSKTLFWIIFLFIGLLLIAFNWLFSNTESYFSFFRFKKVFELILNDKRKYIGHFLMILLVCFLNIILETVFNVSSGLLKLETLYGLALSGILSAITGTYAAFIICKLTANSIKRELKENL